MPYRVGNSSQLFRSVILLVIALRFREMGALQEEKLCTAQYGLKSSPLSKEYALGILHLI